MLVTLRLVIAPTFILLTLPSLSQASSADARAAAREATAPQTVSTAEVFGGGGDEITTRPTVPIRLHAARRLLEGIDPSLLPLKKHRSAEIVVVGGHIKFRHASNAPPFSRF
jgi:hypothetical protein